MSFSQNRRRTASSQSDSLFDRCSWFYALCREHLFHDHTPEIARSLFPNQPTSGTRLLELGCGPGFYACRLGELYPQIHAMGLDVSSRLLERVRSRAARRSLANCSFRYGDAQSIPDLFPIDAIVISRLFLIVPDKQAVISEVFRVLRPGGRCFVVEPTSGLRTSVPLGFMRMLSRVGSFAGRSREPRQAAVMSCTDFSALVRSQPWDSVEVVVDGWYQYAVCTKGTAELVPSETIDLSAV